MKKEYSVVRTSKQYNAKDGEAQISVYGADGVVKDIDKILKKHLDGWEGIYDSIELNEVLRYYVAKCPPNETCWKYVVQDRELKGISVAVFGIENQAQKYCDYLNDI